MNDMWALALGIAFLALWVAVIAYYDPAHRAYTQGRMDHIRHKNRSTEYHGFPAFLYRRGRKAQARKHKIKVHSRMAGGGYGHIHHN